MNEQILDKGQSYNLRIALIIAIVILSLVVIIWTLVLLCITGVWTDAAEHYYYSLSYHHSRNEHCSSCNVFIENGTMYSQVRLSYKGAPALNCPLTYSSLLAYILPLCIDMLLDHSSYLYMLAGVLICFLIFPLLYWWFKNHEIVVTDKRVCGRTALGKHVALPLDAVTAISFSRILHSITVSTPTGHLRFYLIKNAKSIYSTLTEQLIARQSTTISQLPPDSASELRKLNELMDDGIITQEDFDTKKNQLLDL